MFERESKRRLETYEIKRTKSKLPDVSKVQKEREMCGSEKLWTMCKMQLYSGFWKSYCVRTVA